MKNMLTRAIFLKLCPNCGGDISDFRLSLKVPCDKCLPLPDEKVSTLSKQEILEILKSSGNLKKMKTLYEIQTKLEELEELFYKVTGSKLWSAQRTWAKRAFSGKNFAIVAPTGTGKSIFCAILSFYFALKGKRCYIILPTAILVEQMYARIIGFSEKTKAAIKVARYHSMLGNKEIEKERESIRKKEYSILITTSAFLSKNFEMVKGNVFDLVVVDDVDALLKSSKNVDKVLLLAGFSEEAIKKGLKLVELKRQYKRALKKGDISAVSKEIEEIKEFLENFLKTSNLGNIIVSGASSRGRKTKRIMLFKELMGFEVGSRIEFLRNIEDLYVSDVDDMEDYAARLVKMLGKGGIIFVPMDKGLAFAETLHKRLLKEGISVAIYSKSKAKIIDEFSSGKIEVLIGFASYRSPLTRGIDLPHVIRYAIFTGVPKFRISLDVERDFSPTKAMILLSNLKDVLPEDELMLLEKHVYILKEVIGQTREILDAMKNGVKLDGYKGFLQKKLEEVKKYLEEILSRDDVKEKLLASPDIRISEEDGRLYMIAPDAVAYIQASGRTSRMFSGGISKGISVLLVDDEKAFNGLVKESRWFSEEIEWKRLVDVDLQKVLEEVDRDRAIIRESIAGHTKAFTDPITTAVLIVESPNKVKTIARFFGKPSRRSFNGLIVYEVSTGDYILNITASGGHIFDLPTNYSNGLHGVIKDGDVFLPNYITIKRCVKCKRVYTKPVEKCEYCQGDIVDKERIIEALRGLAAETDLILIGTDADAEGEKIGWDVAMALSPYTSKIKRIEFHEITKRALVEGLKNLREIDIKLVEAQMVRRIEDRWIGFELSQKLWKKFKDNTLSAGRVQTPVLGWIIQRFEESKGSFHTFFEIALENGLKFVIKKPLMNDDKALKEADGLAKKVYEIRVEHEEEIELNPPPPYSTDTLLQDAASMLKLNVQKTMSLAQDLFELGLITYHRTDSIRVSSLGQKIAKEYVCEKFDERFFKPREWSKEGAHECIRPTRPIDVFNLRHMITLGVIKLAKKLTQEHFQLYELIFKRFIASQMKQARVLKRKYRISFDGESEFVEGYGKVVEDGFNLLLKLSTIEASEGIFRAVSVKTWKAPTVSLFKQADVIRMMKVKDIGRPSTYAKILMTLFERGYAKENKKKEILPTKKGYKVYLYLHKRFNEFISEETTRRLKEVMDDVEGGKANYQEVLRSLYKEIMSIRGG
jgi:reverse gyrase